MWFKINWISGISTVNTCKMQKLSTPKVLPNAQVQDVIWWPWRCCCPSKVRFWTFVLSGTPASVARTESLNTALRDRFGLWLTWGWWHCCLSLTNCVIWSTDQLPVLLLTLSTLSLGFPAQSASTVTWMTSSSFPPKGNSIHIAGVLSSYARFASFFEAVVGPAASLMISFVLKAMSKRCSVMYWQIPAPDPDSSPLPPANFSHTFDPSQNANQNHQQRCDVWENEFHSGAQVSNLQFQTSSPENFVNSSHTTHQKSSPCCASPNHHKIFCKSTDWCRSVWKAHCQMSTFPWLWCFPRSIDCCLVSPKIMNSWYLKALSRKFPHLLQRAWMLRKRQKQRFQSPCNSLLLPTNTWWKTCLAFLQTSRPRAPRPWTDAHKVVTSLCHLANHRAKPCVTRASWRPIIHNSKASKLNMFFNSSSRPTFNLSSGNFPLNEVRSRLRSTGANLTQKVVYCRKTTRQWTLIRTGSFLRFSPLGCVCRQARRPDWVAMAHKFSSFSNLHLALQQFVHRSQF